MSILDIYLWYIMKIPIYLYTHCKSLAMGGTARDWGTEKLWLVKTDKLIIDKTDIRRNKKKENIY